MSVCVCVCVCDPPQNNLFVGNVGTRLVDMASRSRRCYRNLVARLAIISDIGTHRRIRILGFVDEYHQHVLDMHPTCFYLPWRDTRETRNILSIEASSHDLDL